MKQRQIYKLASIFMILTLITGIAVVTAKQTAIPDREGDRGDKIIPMPTPPQGYTTDQVNKAIDIARREQENLTRTSDATSDAISTTSSQYGDGMYIVRSPVDVQYYVYNIQSCSIYGCYYTYPSLNIPLKVEVWDNNMNPVYNAYTSYSLYYWNYYTNGWSPLNSGTKYTDTNGISRQGFSIPYRTYSDRYWLIQSASYQGKGQSVYTFINVGWY